MANTDNKAAVVDNTAAQLAAVKEYGPAFMKARKGEIKVSCSDIEKLSDLTEIFFGQRISNKADRIHRQAWVDKKGYNSELIIKTLDGTIYKLYSQVSDSKLQQQLP